MEYVPQNASVLEKKGQIFTAIQAVANKGSLRKKGILNIIHFSYIINLIGSGFLYLSLGHGIDWTLAYYGLYFTCDAGTV